MSEGRRKRETVTHVKKSHQMFFSGRVEVGLNPSKVRNKGTEIVVASQQKRYHEDIMG